MRRVLPGREEGIARQVFDDGPIADEAPDEACDAQLMTRHQCPQRGLLASRDPADQNFVRRGGHAPRCMAA